MKILKYLYAVALLYSMHAHAQNWMWAFAPGGLPTTASSVVYRGMEGWLVKAGPDNSIYTAMINYDNNLTVGPYAFYDSVLYNGRSSNACPQTILTRYDLSGRVLWTLGSSGGQAMPIDLATDDSGNVYLFGDCTSDSVRFDTFRLVNTRYDSFSYNKDEYFLLKISPAGKILWLRTGMLSYTSLYFNVSAQGGVAVDKDYNVYIASTTRIDTSFMPPNEDYIFLTKYDAAGHMLWTKNYGGDIEAEVCGLALRGNRLYIAGSFQSTRLVIGSDTLSFVGPPFISGSTLTNGYMAAFDTSGNAVWARSSPSLAAAKTLQIGKTGNLYIGGYAIQGPYMAWGDDSLVIPTSGQAGFLTSVDTNGHTDWLKIFPQKVPSSTGATVNSVYSITIDPCNNVWITGAINAPGGIVLDTTAVFAPAGSTDPMYVAEFSDTGRLLTSFALPTGGDDNTGLAADTFGNLYLCADYLQTDPFIIGRDTLHLPAGLDENFFLAKFSPQHGASAGITASFCTGGSTVLTAPPGFMQYYWSTNAAADSIVVDTGGWYTVYCYGSGCRLVLTQGILVSEVALSPFSQDTAVCGAQGGVVLSTNAPGAAFVVWSTGQTTPAITAGAGSYVATVTQEGCTVTDTFTVTDKACNCTVRMPNIFTPNYDGLNDFFKVVHDNCIFERFALSVYNRWGNLVFHTDDAQEGWDGKYQGKAQDMGVYMYYLDYKTSLDHTTHRLKGSVTLVK